jgi:hypothetical protein
MSKKHFIVYFQNEKAITKTSKEWAEENKEYFPNYANNIPSLTEIDLYLVDNLGFSMVSDNEKYICFNFDENKKNIRFITDNNYENASDYYIYFTIENDEYKLIMDNSVTLSKNNSHILPVKPGLRDIVTRLELNHNEYHYNNAGNERTTNDLATRIYHYIADNFNLENDI